MKELVKFLVENIIQPQLNRDNALTFGCYALLFLMMPAPEAVYNEELEVELAEKVKEVNEVWLTFYAQCEDHIYTNIEYILATHYQ